MLRTLAVGNAASSAPNRAAAEMTTSRGVMPASSARRAAVSRRSSLITAASASGFTPLSVRPTSTAKVSRSRPVCSSCEMSYSTAHKDERQCSASRRCQRPTAEPSRVKAGGRAESRRRYRGVARSAHRQESPRADAPCPVLQCTSLPGEAAWASNKKSPHCEHVCALTRAFPFRLAVFRTADSRLSIFCWPRSRWRRRPRRRRPNTRSKYACEREMEVTLSRDAARLMGTLKDMMDLATSEDGISIGLPCPRSHGLDASDGVQPERQLLNDPDQSPMPSSLT